LCEHRINKDDSEVSIFSGLKETEMKAFISYSHIDERYVQRLHTHLAQMKRDGLIDTWYDREISAGTNLNQEISRHLKESNVFIAVTSPDFLDSEYCFDIEMSKAIEDHHAGQIRIIPLIVEPCDWLNSPLKDFRATPRDGKPISDWSNINSAYLDIITDLRKLTNPKAKPARKAATKAQPKTTRTPTFRTKKDFDKIDKIEFKKGAFDEIAAKLETWCIEANNVEGIKALYERAKDNRFFVTLVNKNKSNSTSERTVYLSEDRHGFGDINLLHERSESSSSSNGGFTVEADDYRLFLKRSFSMHSPVKEKLNPTEAAHEIWNEMMQSVGIEYAD